MISNNRFRIRQNASWEELGDAGEARVQAAVPRQYTVFPNVLVPCSHGDKDFEEIDLVAVGPTGIWAVEVKAWRGVLTASEDPQEFICVRPNASGVSESYRENPYYLARGHADDLRGYLSDQLRTNEFKAQTLIVFAFRDSYGINGINMEFVRLQNPSFVYADEISTILLRFGRSLYKPYDTSRLKQALNRLPTWDNICFADGTRKRGFLWEWPGLEIYTGNGLQRVLRKDLSSVKFRRANQGMFAHCYRYSGEILIGLVRVGKIPLVSPNGMHLDWINIHDIVEIRCGGLSPRMPSLSFTAFGNIGGND